MSGLKYSVREMSSNRQRVVQFKSRGQRGSIKDAWETVDGELFHQQYISGNLLWITEQLQPEICIMSSDRTGVVILKKLK